MKSMKQTRARLFARDPHCYWCGCLTVNCDIPRKGHPLPQSATVDHIRSRLDPQRVIYEPQRRRLVLACWQCNHDRDVAETKALLKEELWRRSGHLSRKFNVDVVVERGGCGQL